MEKGLGFNSTLRLDWLDKTASLCCQRLPQPEVRRQLLETLSDSIQGAAVRKKTLGVLMGIWFKTQTLSPQLHSEAVRLFPTLPAAEERLWLHYGLALLRYPLFRSSTRALGQIGRAQETVTRRQVKERMAGEFGHLGSLDRAVERLLASLFHWGLLRNGERKGEYRLMQHSLKAAPAVQLWMIGCALTAHPAQTLPFNDLLHLPELFPFQFSLGVDDLRRAEHIEVQRQGGGLEMVQST
mgnify:CR=1 FL=1